MADEAKNFGDVAQKLARNPLGIIALFIVLVYGIAALVTAFAGEFSTGERIPLIYFLVLFPVLVLGVFAWLVSRHTGKLFSPKDFQDEENYVRMLSATASLAVAQVKKEARPSVDDINEVVGTVRESSVFGTHSSGSSGWHDRVLWVDDHPDNNIHERNAFEAMGISFTLAESTGEALEELRERRFAAIISDMGRREGPREGYVLLDKIRDLKNETPFFIYSSSDLPEYRLETLEHGGQGSTNDAQKLFRMVMRAVVKR